MDSKTFNISYKLEGIFNDPQFELFKKVNKIVDQSKYVED